MKHRQHTEKTGCGERRKFLSFRVKAIGYMLRFIVSHSAGNYKNFNKNVTIVRINSGKNLYSGLLVVYNSSQR